MADEQTGKEVGSQGNVAASSGTVTTVGDELEADGWTAITADWKNQPWADWSHPETGEFKRTYNAPKEASGSTAKQAPKA